MGKKKPDNVLILASFRSVRKSITQGMKTNFYLIRNELKEKILEEAVE